MFIDRATIYVKSGNGGNGVATFHREKYVAAGGPDGGDGGNGGNIIFEASKNVTTLADFKYKRKYVAENGKDGMGNKMTGRRGEDVIIKVPCGTVIRDKKTNALIADMVTDGETRVIAKGGRGGQGNRHFATATRQVPNFAKAGEVGEEFELLLELKLLADAGLIGFPNVGKSTILSVTTEAKPEIADYHFTTITPHLGVFQADEEGKSFVLADIPGLIEGASEGQGLGHHFLRHIERTRLLIHVIDMSGSEGRDPFDDFILINGELSKYNEHLATRPQIIVANKMDGLQSEENLKIFKEKFNTWLEEQKENNPETAEQCELGCYRIFETMAAISEGTHQLMSYVATVLQRLPDVSTFMEMQDDEMLYTAEEANENEPLYTIEIDEDGVYEIKGRWIESVFNSVNLGDSESEQYFQRLLRQKGVIDKLTEMGIKEEDLVRILDTEFEFFF